ncbi:ABC transporter ATP-binding protein [Mycolicibacterium palauense]|uniref:ABC transporter ATP-binding protein n=1 Tax=Mycolicibacterium palauense TaxID=2034511 RepID=UPI000BFED004|nr:ABC transporter ATP-binding protein [Mycolicibacterium palauense]
MTTRTDPLTDDPVSRTAAAATPDGDSPQPLLEVRGLTVHFGLAHAQFTAVDDVAIALRPGERAALIGESGSGKSTTCLAIAGYLTYTDAIVAADRLAFDGRAMTPGASRLPRRVPGISMVFQDAMTSLDPVWTAGSQLRAVVRASGVPRKQVEEVSRQWLTRVGLTDVDRVMRNRPYELSGGMRQRVMLAIALAGKPKLLIADEPTSALDSSLAREMMELLLNLTQESGAALLIVSHDIRMAQEYCDRVFVMYGGRIIEEGPSEELRHAPAHPYTRGLLNSIPTMENIDLDELPTIPPPAPGPVGGCSFRPRCTRASSECAAVPERTPVDLGHIVRCHHPHPASEPLVAGHVTGCPA